MLGKTKITIRKRWKIGSTRTLKCTGYELTIFMLNADDMSRPTLRIEHNRPFTKGRIREFLKMAKYEEECRVYSILVLPTYKTPDGGFVSFPDELREVKGRDCPGFMNYNKAMQLLDKSVADQIKGEKNDS